MSAEQTGFDRLMQISDELASHERDMEASPDYALPEDFIYRGYGQELTLPDGRSYGAYVGRLMDAPGRLQIDFYGEARHDPERLAKLGHIILLPHKSQVSFGDVNSFGRDPSVDASQHTHTFPRVVALARPLGDWLADGAQEVLDKRAARRDAGVDFRTEFDRLRQYLGEGAQGIRDSIALEQAYSMVRRTLAASRRIDANTTRTLRSPSLEEVEPFDRLVHGPDGASLFTLTDEVQRLFIATRVAGPLLR